MIRSIKLWKPAVAGALTTVGTMLFAPSAQAAVSWTNLTTNLNLTFVDKNLLAVLITLINLVLFVAAVVAFVYAIWGGFQYITAGSDDEKAGNGRKMITNAVIGLVIIALAYAIIRFATATIGNLNANATPGGAAAPGSIFNSTQ